MKLMSTEPDNTDAERRRAPSPPDMLRLDSFLPYRLNVLAQVVSEGLARIYSQRFGIGIPEWRIIATLGEFGQMTARDVGAHSRMHKTKVSRAVASLEERGLVERRANEEDRREAFLSLTPAGLKVYAGITPLALGYAERLTEGLAAEDLETLERIIAQLTERSGILQQEPPEIDL
ncbi:MarR family transcriptional regulator [Chelatococcus sp. SYSU_G07232]|uniref:MarR family transcriptional regulator n=1 Tax=Chelatococcus albus TaxID=3047466 RepID=A0ABT7AKE6_9HYPH|nr:MarR family transcriptional regulator [Chelatococcus sp. SYSU_G07232]MDJ1159845.1 MarR family transcriptional regulator [Chelatococcus sp. SYSU_G07232]